MCIGTIKNTSMGIEHLHIILSTRRSPRRALVRTVKTTEMHQKVDFFTFYSFHEKGRGSQARTAARAPLRAHAYSVRATSKFISKVY